MKIVCKKCKTEKDSDEFYKRKKKKNGHSSSCKVCVKKSNYESVKKYRKNNPNKYKESYSKSNKKYFENHKEELREKQRKWNRENKEYRKNFNKENKDKINETRRVYRENNRERINKTAREYFKNKMDNDDLFKLRVNIKNSINMSFKNRNFKKNSKSTEILGCSFEEFKIYLEGGFESWMNWDNHGLYNGELNHGWDIDHIIPIVSAKSEEDIIKLNHYTNLQPLCSYVNRNIKRDNLNF